MVKHKPYRIKEEWMTALELFQNHLRELFQLDDTADLDFGIYRLFSNGVVPL